MIKIENLSFTYPGAECQALKGINMTIQSGDFVAIIGGNGSGKTTLCKTLNGLIPHYSVGDFKGSVLVNGKQVQETPVSVLSKEVAYVYQDYENQLLRPTVLEDVCFAPLNYGYKDYRQRGQKALELLGIQSLAHQFIWELSGGQKHMVALAGVLSLDPQVIIVDEPAAQLDPQNALLIYEKLKFLNEQLNKTILVIEHHTEFIGKFAHQVIAMEKGQVLWQAPVQEALNHVEDLMNMNIFPPQVTQVAYELHKQGLGSGPLPITVEGWKDFGDRPVGTMVSTMPKELIAPSDEVTVSFHQVNQSYKTLEGGVKQVLKDINLTFRTGERIALIGSNGAGKSTLIKMMTGLIKPKSGHVYVGEWCTQHTSPEVLADEVSYIYQNPEHMFIEDTIKGDISYYLKARKLPDREAFVQSVIRRFHLSELQDQDGRLLSGGQQRRASLAIGMATRPKIVLLDEPTASLDIASRKEMIEMLDLLKGTVKTVIVATHDMQLVAEWADRVIVLERGQVIAEGTSEEILNEQDLLDRANLLPPQVVELSRRLGLDPVAMTVEACTERLLAERGGKHVGVR